MFCRRLDAGLLVAISCSSSQIVHTPFPVVKNSLKYGNTIHHQLIFLIFSLLISLTVLIN